MSAMKPITVHSHAKGPNPRKVLMVLDELEVPYEVILVENPKDESFTKINPNGRLPAIEDPNTGITLWESGAILEYIVDTYDKESKLTFTTLPEKYQLKQYLHFQMSGQGPYFGQRAWFEWFHPEPVQSAKDRYTKEIERVVSVLDTVLKGKQYLVGEKCTYVDLAFVPWDNGIPKLTNKSWEELEFEKKYPNFWQWHQRLMARPTVAKNMQ